MNNEVVHIIDTINIIIERTILIVILVSVLRIRNDMQKGNKK